MMNHGISRIQSQFTFSVMILAVGVCHAGIAFAQSGTTMAAGSPAAAGFVRTAQPAPVLTETLCTRNDADPGLPTQVGFKIVDENQIDLWVLDQAQQAMETTRMQSIFAPSQPALAVFNIATYRSRSGELKHDIKVLISRSALKFRNVGHLLLTNRSSGELSSYHCRQQ